MNGSARADARRLVATLAIAAIVVVAPMAVATPPTATTTGLPVAPSTLIGCDQADVRVQVTVSSHLDPSCEYHAGFDITASDVVLDCMGALITKVGGARGIEISTPADVSMANVTVRNCRVEGFLNSIRATRVGFRSLAAGHEFDHTLSDIVIENSELRDSHGVGAFVDGYVSRVTLRNLTIQGAGSTGIYLEAGSKENTVVGNEIIDNGFTENGPDGQIEVVGGLRFRYWGTGREGLAIDGSFDNVVRDNHFSGNAAGGIFVYTNCGEYVTSNPGRWYERRYGAERNLIEQNTFDGGVNGVWVGARMGENTYPMECSQEAYVEEGAERIVLDRAANNTVQDNTFNDVTYGVRVEDDGTTVADNTFAAPDATHHAIVVGTRVRTPVLGLPVRDTTITGNQSTIVGNRHPYRWVHGQLNTTFGANVALGQEVGLCEGRELPHNIFVMVLKIAYEPLGSPVTPTPDLTWPTVGELPSCDPAVPPTIVPGSASVVEGDAGTTTLDVPVTLSEPSVNTVTADWSTIPAGAWARATVGTGPADDVVAGSGTVTFAPGQTTATVQVQVRGDVEPEADESFAVSFRNATNGRVGGFYGLALGFVIDDEWPKVVPGSAEGAEGSGSILVPVMLSAPAAGTVTVAWQTATVAGALPTQAVAGSDYTPAAGTVTFAPGEQTAYIEIPLVDDGVAEPDEYVVIHLHDPVGARLGPNWGLGFANIVDDD